MTILVGHLDATAAMATWFWRADLSAPSRALVPFVEPAAEVNADNDPELLAHIAEALVIASEEG